MPSLIDICPICGGRGNFLSLDKIKICHGCHGSGYKKIQDASTKKSKRIKVENDSKVKSNNR